MEKVKYSMFINRPADLEWILFQDPTKQVAGHFSKNPKPLRKRAGALLYLIMSGPDEML
jgi:hypothetical protein